MFTDEAFLQRAAAQKGVAVGCMQEFIAFRVTCRQFHGFFGRGAGGFADGNGAGILVHEMPNAF